MDNFQLINEFARFAGMECDQAELDFGHEILGQMPCTGWPFGNHPSDAGLFLGCPLTIQKRELSRDILFWCPFGWLPGRFKAIVCSRAGGKLAEGGIFAHALRNFLIHLSPDDVVVTASGSTLDFAVRRGTQLFSTRSIRLEPFPVKIGPDWISRTLQPDPNACVIFYQGSHPSPDDLMFAISDEVRVINARSGGNIMRLIETYKDPQTGPVVMTLVQPPDTRDCDHAGNPGSVAWYLFEEYEPATDEQDDPGSFARGSTIRLDEIDGDYLSHWTRLDRRPWPDQTMFNQFDHLFLGETVESGPLRSLCRILVQQKLLASGHLIRGGDRVVCFTEVPISDFPSRRVFRPHQTRWDFELFGISIRRDAVKRLGARPVQYVSREDFPEILKPDESTHIVLTSDESSVDWSREREWRIVGDVNLRLIGPDEAVVFVPDISSANVIRQFSRWPVVILDSSSVSAR